jgi:hypothetical protein
MNENKKTGAREELSRKNALQKPSLSSQRGITLNLSKYEVKQLKKQEIKFNILLNYSGGDLLL